MLVTEQVSDAFMMMSWSCAAFLNPVHTKRQETSKRLAHRLGLKLSDLMKTRTKGQSRFTTRLSRANRQRSNTWIGKQEVIRMEFLRTDIKPACESG